MNEVLKNLWSQITSASGPVKVALGSCGLLLALVTSVMVWRAQNPHFVVLAADLDSHSFNGAVKALAEAGIRYETSVGGPPYVIQVESGRRHEAIAAMHVSGEFLDDARGISSGLEGSSAVFLGQSERHQRTQKRMWEEVELSLEKLNFVSQAKVTVSGAPTSTLASLRQDARRASVIVTLRGVAKPTATETRALVGLVRGGTGVTDERMTIVDQHSNVLFDGVDESGADSLAAKEEQFNRERTEMAQRQLDRVFGPGVAVVGVTSEWLQIQEESVVETLNPGEEAALVADTHHQRLGPAAADRRARGHRLQPERERIHDDGGPQPQRVHQHRGAAAQLLRLDHDPHRQTAAPAPAPVGLARGRCVHRGPQEERRGHPQGLPRIQRDPRRPGCSRSSTRSLASSATPRAPRSSPRPRRPRRRPTRP